MDKCQAHQQSDQKRCERCDLTWDMNDSDPPECRTPHDIAMDAMRKDLGAVCIDESTDGPKKCKVFAKSGAVVSVVCEH